MASNNKSQKKQTRVKKNQKTYGQKVVVKDDRIHKGIFIILILSLLANTFLIYHFITFNHNKTKEVTKIKEVVSENIVFLGDSITHGYDLEKYFGDEYHIVNSGIDGNTTDDILNDLKERVYDYNPSKVFLLIGTNDITFNKTNTYISDNIKKIIESIQKNRPQCKIYLEAIYPVNNGDNEKIDHDMVKSRTNETIKDINKKLKEYCQENDITYIDLYDDLIDEEDKLKLDYTIEGLHISDKGYDVITAKIKEYLKDDE